MKREAAELNIEERNEGCSSAIIEMVFRGLALLSHTERDVQIVPNKHKCALAGQPNDLRKSLLTKKFNFVDGGGVR